MFLYNLHDCTFLRADGSKVNKTYYHIWWCTFTAITQKSICVMNVKGNAQFIFLCNPKKSGASRAFIPFLQVTQKILTKNLFHWLEVITEILSFQQIFNVRKKNHSLFWIFQKSEKNWQKNYIPGIFWAFKSKLQIILAANYIALFLPDTTVFICIIPYIHICSYYFLIFCFYFHLLFLNLSAMIHILQFTMFHIISLQTARNITEIRNDERKSVNALIFLG